MRKGRRVTVAAVVAATILAAGTTGVGTTLAAKGKPRVTQVSVDSESTIKLSTFPLPNNDIRGVTNATGMRFSGSLAFKKVHVDFKNRAKLTKTIKNKARRTCVKLFAGGPVKGYTPKVQVWAHIGPLPGTLFVTKELSLVTSETRDTEISGAGTKTVLWNEQATTAASYEKSGGTWYGISPGYPIFAKGGWWDTSRDHFRDQSGTFKVNQRGRRGKVKVNCRRFSVSTEWNG